MTTVTLNGTYIKILAIAALTLLTSCGNLWVSHKTRDASPSELFRDGKLAADKLDFDTAIEAFSKSLALDPNNDNTRMRLAYTYNAKASLGALDIYKNLEASKSKSLNAAEGGLSEVAKLIGFTAADKQAFADKLKANPDRNIDTVRGFSDRLVTINLGWSTVCRLLPSTIIEEFITKDSNTSRVMNGATCRRGLDEVSGSSAAFAAIMQLLTEAIYIYQTILDVDDDGQIDFVAQATAVNNDIKTVQASIATATGTSITTLMTTLNTSLAKLKEIGDVFRSDPVLVAITDFAVVGQLVTSVAGIPDDLKEKMTASSGKLAGAKAIIDSFSTSASSGSGSTSSGGASASTEAASKAMEDLSAKMDTLSGAEKAQAQVQFNQACTQFDSVKSVYGLPASTQKPAGCQ